MNYVGLLDFVPYCYWCPMWRYVKDCSLDRCLMSRLVIIDTVMFLLVLLGNMIL